MSAKSSYQNPDILERFDELIREGNRLNQEYLTNPAKSLDSLAITQWTTSCFNLLDKLSASTNRFVMEFEYYGRVKDSIFLVGAALGVLKSAREEYSRGLAIDYHLSVSASVFSGLLDEARYLLSKDYLRASAVIAGAALEEGLKTRARMISAQEIPENLTLTPLIHRLKSDDVGILTEFEATRLEAIAKLRNDAAHGGKFEYQKKDVEEMITETEKTLGRVLGAR